MCRVHFPLSTSFPSRFYHFQKLEDFVILLKRVLSSFYFYFYHDHILYFAVYGIVSGAILFRSWLHSTLNNSFFLAIPFCTSSFLRHLLLLQTISFCQYHTLLKCYLEMAFTNLALRYLSAFSLFLQSYFVHVDLSTSTLFVSEFYYSM